MKDTRELKIENDSVRITLRYARATIGAQLGLLAGLVALYMFSKTATVKQLCKVFLIMDAVCVLFTLLRNLSISVSDVDSGKLPKDGSKPAQPKPATQSAPDTTAPDVTVEAESRRSNKKSSKQESSETVQNKIVIPAGVSVNPTPSAPPPPSPAPQPVSQASAQPVPTLQPDPIPAPASPISSQNVSFDEIFANSTPVVAEAPPPEPAPAPKPKPAKAEMEFTDWSSLLSSLGDEDD